MDIIIHLVIKFVEINYMYVKIVDIHQLIQRIIMNISKVFIHIHHLYIDIMIKDNLNLIQIHHQIIIRQDQTDHFHHHWKTIWNRIECIFFLFFLYEEISIKIIKIIIKIFLYALEIHEKIILWVHIERRKRRWYLSMNID